MSSQSKIYGRITGRFRYSFYLGAPSAKLNKPREELAAFAKTRLLASGKSQTLSFELNARDLSPFDTAASSWLAEAGEYKVKVGASSRNIRQTASFRLGEDIIAKKVNWALSPQREINILKQAD